MSRLRGHRGYTLIELVCVIGIVTLLASLLLPAFSSARADARQVTCSSNLRQIGLAVGLYAQDADDRYPYGADPIDQETDIWDNSRYKEQVAAMPKLNDILDPYVRMAQIWHCPADTGYDVADYNFINGQPVPLHARPTAFERFGTSYYYHTALALEQKPYATAGNYERTAPYMEHGPAELPVLFDQNGSWHGGTAYSQKRLNALMADGHTSSLTFDQFERIWSLSLDPGP